MSHLGAGTVGVVWTQGSRASKGSRRARGSGWAGARAWARARCGVRVTFRRLAPPACRGQLQQASPGLSAFPAQPSMWQMRAGGTGLACHVPVTAPLHSTVERGFPRRVSAPSMCWKAAHAPRWGAGGWRWCHGAHLGGHGRGFPLGVAQSAPGWAGLRGRAGFWDHPLAWRCSRPQARGCCPRTSRVLLRLSVLGGDGSASLCPGQGWAWLCARQVQVSLRAPGWRRPPRLRALLPQGSHNTVTEGGDRL